MRGLRVDRALIGTALALVAASVMANVLAGSNVAKAESPAENPKEIEALVPLPDAADVPPPSLADMVGLPMPEPATVGTIVFPPPAAPEPKTAAAPPEPAAAAAQPEAPPAPASEPSATVSAPATPATTESPAAAPAKEPAKPVIATDLSPADQAIAEKLRELLAGKAERIFDRKKERTTAEAFYAGRGYEKLRMIERYYSNGAAAWVMVKWLGKQSKVES